MSRSRRLSVRLAALAVAAGILGADTTVEAQTSPKPAAGTYGIGREATAAEVAGWDIDIRPDGQGLPKGRGSAKEGEPLYNQLCSACHGEFGESAGRWPYLSGGLGSLRTDDPVKSIGSYWPYASTVIDYIRRAMPFGNAQSLTNDELYAITAYVLYLNDIIKDDGFVLSEATFKSIKLPNEANFYDDDRDVTEKRFWRKDPCMKDCLTGPPRIIGRARAIDVTPEQGQAPKVQ